MISQSEGFTSVSLLWGPMVFHAVTTGLGTALLGKAIWPQPKVAVQVQQ